MDQSKQGESEYYRPLVQRVIEITAAEGETAGSPKPSVVLTGHSLGAGLARIVGTLTGQASVRILHWLFFCCCRSGSGSGTNNINCSSS